MDKKSMKSTNHYRWGRVVNEEEQGCRLLTVLDSSGVEWHFVEPTMRFSGDDRVELIISPGAKSPTMIHRNSELSTVRCNGGFTFKSL